MLSRRALAFGSMGLLCCSVIPAGLAGAMALWPDIARLKLAAGGLNRRIPGMSAQLAEYAGHIIAEAEALPYLAGAVSRHVFLRYHAHLHVIGGYGSIIEHVAEDARLARQGSDIFAGSMAMLDRARQLRKA